MPRALFANSTTHNRGPVLIGAGLALVLASQLAPAIPLAAAIALVGLGATSALVRHRQSELLVAINFAVYGALVALAISAQMNLGNNVLIQCDAIVAIILIVVAIPRSALAGRDS